MSRCQCMHLIIFSAKKSSKLSCESQQRLAAAINNVDASVAANESMRCILSNFEL